MNSKNDIHHFTPLVDNPRKCTICGHQKNNVLHALIPPASDTAADDPKCSEIDKAEQYGRVMVTPRAPDYDNPNEEDDYGCTTHT